MSLFILFPQWLTNFPSGKQNQGITNFQWTALVRCKNMYKLWTLCSIHQWNNHRKRHSTLVQMKLLRNWDKISQMTEIFRLSYQFHTLSHLVINKWYDKSKLQSFKYVTIISNNFYNVYYDISCFIKIQYLQWYIINLHKNNK